MISNQQANFILLGTRRSTVTKPKGYRRKETKITAEIKNRKPIEKYHKTKNQFYDNNRTDKLLGRLIKEKRKSKLLK